MARQIIFARRYVHEFETQLRRIAADRPLAARRMSDRIASLLRLLADNPELGRAGRIAGTRELVIPRTPYVACYRLAHDRIEMLPFRHGRQRWPKRL